MIINLLIILPSFKLAAAFAMPCWWMQADMFVLKELQASSLSHSWIATNQYYSHPIVGDTYTLPQAASHLRVHLGPTMGRNALPVTELGIPYTWITRHISLTIGLDLRQHGGAWSSEIFSCCCLADLYKLHQTTYLFSADLLAAISIERFWFRLFCCFVWRDSLL